MNYDYEVHTDGTVTLLRCYGEEERIAVPEQLEGHSVTRLAPYLFSHARREPDREHAICGEQVREIRLPESIREIGSYAFYGCYRLEKLTFSHRIRDIAGGAFTGCHHVRELQVQMDGAKGYCLKDILSELHHELRVRLEYGEAPCTLLFPEYYEEAVENTPARQLETEFHGSGYSYRQCFRDGVLQFFEYDRLFADAQHLESEDFCIELALCRLREPHALSETAKGCYQSWLMEHRMSAAHWCIVFEQEEALEYLSEFIDWRKEETEALILVANEQGRLQMQSFLMDYSHSHFEKKKKTFEL